MPKCGRDKKYEKAFGKCIPKVWEKTVDIPQKISWEKDVLHEVIVVPRNFNYMDDEWNVQYIGTGLFNMRKGREVSPPIELDAWVIKHFPNRKEALRYAYKLIKEE